VIEMEQMVAGTKVGQPYTAGSWVVRAGEEEEFIKRWTAFTRWAQDEADGAHGFILIRDVDEPTRFQSFGAWESPEAVAAWKSTPEFMHYLGRCRELCDDFQAANYAVASVVTP
jgi:heme-degrading monooxygenase HmoA